MPWRLQSEPTAGERVCAGLSYFTFGISGLLYMLLSRSSNQSPLFRFHFFQAVLLSIIFAMLRWGALPLEDILVRLLSMVSADWAIHLGEGLGFAGSVFEKACYLLLGYGGIMAFLGKFAEVPFISNVVRQNMRA